MTLRLPSAGNSSELRLSNGCFPGLPGERSSDRRTGLPGGFELPGPSLLLAGRERVAEEKWGWRGTPPQEDCV